MVPWNTGDPFPVDKVTVLMLADDAAQQQGILPFIKKVGLVVNRHVTPLAAAVPRCLTACFSMATLHCMDHPLFQVTMQVMDAFACIPRMQNGSIKNSLRVVIASQS